MCSVGINSSSRLKGSMELRSERGREELRRKIGDAVLHTLVFFFVVVSPGTGNIDFIYMS